MKKLLGILLVLVMFVTPVFAENNGFESKTTDELLVMKNELDMEIAKRLGAIGAIHSGTYIVGRDIKAGRYVLYLEGVVRGWKSYIQIYTIDTTEEEIKDSRYLSEGETFSFLLEEGQALYLQDVSVGFLEVVDKPVWAP